MLKTKSFEITKFQLFVNKNDEPTRKGVTWAIKCIELFFR